MRKICVAFLAVLILVGTSAWAQCPGQVKAEKKQCGSSCPATKSCGSCKGTSDCSCGSCSKGSCNKESCGKESGLTVSGYMAPNFRMIDTGEDNSSNIGFGMSFNRLTFSGVLPCGEIVKKVGWKVESDFSQTGAQDLQWAYVQPSFNDMFSVRFGHIKRAFSRELLHPTSKLLTVDRHPTTGFLLRQGYGGFSYGIEAHVTDAKFMVQAGAYSGAGSPKRVGQQDPAIDFGARAIFKPLCDLQVGANVMMLALPSNGPHLDDQGSNQVAYVDSTYESNSGMAFGFDLDYQKVFNPNMGLWVQAEFGMGDAWLQLDDAGDWVPLPNEEDRNDEDTWEDFPWFSFMYYNLKALFMVTSQFGIHAGYSVIDPNTDSNDGPNDRLTLITPGIVYKWCKWTRTQAEVQMETRQMGCGESDDTYTHFVVQQVFTWK